MPIKFSFRWIPFIATVIAMIVGVSLGHWQTRRAQEKESIQEKIAMRGKAMPINLAQEASDLELMEYRHAKVKGQFVSDWPIYLENRPYRGAAGFYVVMPFKIADTEKYVLVARGWAKREISDRMKLPEYVTSVATIEIQGMITRNAGRLMQLGNANEMKPGAIMQNLDINAFSVASKLSLYPFVIEQTNDVQDGLVRDWPKPSFGIEKHQGYAFQWYALAATAFIFFVVTGCSRGRK